MTSRARRSARRRSSGRRGSRCGRDVPILALITRLAPQKGVDVFAHALDRILAWDVQVVMLGSGDPEAERFFAARARAQRDRFCAWFPFDDARAHRVQAGADFFVMPSRFEPCGLGQLYAMRYGTLPIVRATGGLVDTVTSYDEASGAGTGFVFDDLDPGSLADTIGWAVSTWYNRPAHIEAMRRRAMRDDHSWDRAAREYVRALPGGLRAPARPRLSRDRFRPAPRCCRPSAGSRFAFGSGEDEGRGAPAESPRPPRVARTERAEPRACPAQAAGRSARARVKTARTFQADAVAIAVYVALAGAFMR